MLILLPKSFKDINLYLNLNAIQAYCVTFNAIIMVENFLVNLYVIAFK
ncbi:hypothetical protein MgSA37_04437 [Mucilaginibacter gotjawali]|uniref:Uncharacterized protein n=2 Tax=Mucilaginibacter gotjawali TaxID=1550579 RepID=A0A0X8X607_9SPHI|nr:hypothetical protein [Mucilaginibacter gotjawali]BAU56240.1 hypothetical protein MgSA37_04437 [Mucilaginibacter gotjawali]